MEPPVWGVGKPAAFAGWTRPSDDRYAGPSTFKPSKAIDEVMPELFGELWDADLKTQLEQALRHLREGK